jgi:hypothetical protein
MKYIIFLFYFLSWIASCQNISAGSYPYAEIYRYKINADTLISQLIALKEKDSTLIPPLDLHLIDGKKDSSDYWYNIYFFNKNTKDIYFTWVREQSNEISDVGFVSVNEGLKLGDWKTINNDYDDVKNENKKREFQDLILSKLNIRPVQ